MTPAALRLASFVALCLLVLPRSALAQEAGEAPAEAEASQPSPPPPSPPRTALPSATLDVVHAEGVEGARPGDVVEPGRELTVPAGGCLRLLSGTHASVALVGPARARLGRQGEDTTVEVTSGRGSMTADGRGATIRVGSHALTAQGGTVEFDADRSPAATLRGGESHLDGAPLEPLSAAETSPPPAALCMPPRPEITVPLGDAEEALAAVDREEAGAGEEGSESTSAEASATCVDSAADASATDPTEGTEGGIDPDARRDAGRVRIIVRLPTVGR